MVRFRTVCPAILQYLDSRPGQIRLVDYGCGQDILFKKYFDSTYPSYASRIHYIGLDPLIASNSDPSLHGIEIIRSQFEKVKLSSKADVTIMLAVLEHVDDAALLLEVALHNTSKGGIIVGTTPSPLAKLPLEFLSYTLGIISTREIEEHKRYPTRQTITTALKKITETSPVKLYHTHRYFEFGLNNYFFIKKLS